MTAPEEIYGQLADLAPSGDPAAALRLGAAHWAEMSARDPNAHDAESCRLLSLAAIEQNPPDFVTAEVWRTRALARFALVGWHEGVAAALMGRAFSELGRANDDYAAGATLDVIRGSEAALYILNEHELFIRVAPSGSASVPGPLRASGAVPRRRAFFCSP